MFIVNFFASSTAVTLFDPVFIFSYQFMFTLLNIILRGIFEEPYQTQILEEFPAIYLDGVNVKLRRLRKFFISIILEGGS